ncbi:MAG TPA: DUF2207 domain-containing protein [archaeon]|nr:DUF2207 domain-containing protein [archaeon]
MKKIFLSAMLFLIILSTGAQAKSFSIESADISAKILPDGSVDFSQTIAINFAGSFSEGFVDLDLDAEQKAAFDDSSVSVREYGKEGDDRLSATVSSSSKGKTITWIMSANNEKRTFIISYKLKKTVVAYADVSEFYWKVWGAGWASPVKKMKISIELPREVSDKNNLLGWGHPQLNGIVTIADNKTVLLDVKNIPAQQWVEARVVFPANILSSTAGTKVSSLAAKDKILKEEENYGKQTEAQDQGIPGIILGLGLFSIFIFPAAIIILFLYFYFKYGREPKLPEQNFIYYRDIPYNYGPAVADYILGWGVQENDISATFMDLVRRKFFKIEEFRKDKFLGIFGDDKDYTITNLGKPIDELKPHEKKVFDLFSENMAGGKISISEFQKKVSSNYKYTNFFSEWQKLVEQEVKALGVIDNTGRDKFLKLGVGILLVTFVLTFLSFGIMMLGAILSGFTYTILIFAFKDALARRTPLGAEHYAKWKGLKKFLSDFGIMKEKMPKEVYLWEQYLVFATTFGIADKVSKYMDTQFPVEQRRRSALYTGGSFAIYAAPAFRNSFSSFGPSRSSGYRGHGGGFSGGGGHGGGGGGGGFR